MRFPLFASILTLAMAASNSALAHCDSLDGPVVTAARKALATGNVNLVLIWIPAKDEPEIRRAFSSTLSVRKLNPEARELADRYFFETLVRVHRAGEGEPYTGLKPAGLDPGAGVKAADRAVEAGTADVLAKGIAAAAEEAVLEKFRLVAARRRFGPSDVAAGRAYVQVYVGFLHYVEGLDQAVHRGAHGHGPEPAAGPGDHSH